jgi:ketosteroid isomerase-like protein
MARTSKMPGTAEHAEAAFYDAIARADIEALMALWADEEDIVCIHPGAPRLTGHAAIRSSWEAILEHGGVRIRATKLRELHNLMTSVHSVVEEIHRPEGEPQEVHIVATNVYVKTAQGWRIVLHHASVAPGQAPAEPVASNMLH